MHKLLYFSLINLKRYNQTVGCNRNPVIGQLQNFWSPKEHRKGFRISDPPKNIKNGSEFQIPQRTLQRVQNFWSFKDHYNESRSDPLSLSQLAYLMWSKNLTSGHGNRPLTVITYTKRAFKNTTVHYRDDNSRLLFTCIFSILIYFFHLNVSY